MIPSKAVAKAAPAGIAIPMGPVLVSAFAGGTRTESEVDWSMDHPAGLPAAQGEWTISEDILMAAPATPSQPTHPQSAPVTPPYD